VIQLPNRITPLPLLSYGTVGERLRYHYAVALGELKTNHPLAYRRLFVLSSLFTRRNYMARTEYITVTVSPEVKQALEAERVTLNLPMSEHVANILSAHVSRQIIRTRLNDVQLARK
jgi:hypothetical protein